MKNLYKIVGCFIVLSFSACNSFDLDLQENPLAVTPANASLNDLYNSVGLNFGSFVQQVQQPAGQVARMHMNVNFTYEAAYPDNNGALNGGWTNAYAGIFPDIDNVLLLAEEAGFDIHAGTSKIMEAYVLLTLVDLFGTAPYSEALQGTDIISPTHDAGADIYNAAIALLDEGIAQLSGTSAGAPAYDNYYGGDADNWIAAANSIKLKAALNMGDGSLFSSTLSSNIIDAADGSEDFQANWGTERNNPNSRHPFYNNQYEVGDGSYQANYYMWMLRAEKVNAAGNIVIDPRLRYYFYRKVDDAVNQDPTTYSCHFSTLPDQDAAPPHWEAVDPRLPYCVASADGYSGRDHLNGEGIPPDGPIRTSYGLYPAGGQFDDDTFDDTRQLGTTGGLGGGITPIMMASWVDFMRAEAALTLGTGESARDLLQSGIEKSLDKVESFESLVSSTMSTEVTLRDGSSGTVKELYGMDEDSKTAYINEVLAMYDAAANDDDRLDVIVKEHYIAAWGNGMEAYNMWRRTGKPSNMQPAIEPAFGQFPYSFLFPINHVTRNQNIEQKTLADRVFWNVGGPTVY